MISIQWYRTISTSSKRKRRIIVYGSVARYGPQSVAKRKRLKGLFEKSRRSSMTWNIYVK